MFFRLVAFLCQPCQQNRGQHYIPPNGLTLPTGIAGPTICHVHALSRRNRFAFIIIFCLALVFLSLGMVPSSAYHKRMNWPFLVLSITISGATGFPHLLTGASQSFDIGFGVLAGLVTIWVLVMVIVIWLTRKVW